MNILTGLQNFLLFINDNWVNIMVIIGLLVGLYQKVTAYMSKSTEEKVDIAKTQIQEIILKMVSEAEVDYEDWDKAGSIKRSQVIEKIYTTYPILSKVIDQTGLIKWIDGLIDDALGTLRDVILTDAIADDEGEEVTEE